MNVHVFSQVNQVASPLSEEEPRYTIKPVWISPCGVTLILWESLKLIKWSLDGDMMRMHLLPTHLMQDEGKEDSTLFWRRSPIVCRTNSGDFLNRRYKWTLTNQKGHLIYHFQCHWDLFYKMFIYEIFYKMLNFVTSLYIWSKDNMSHVHCFFPPFYLPSLLPSFSVIFVFFTIIIDSDIEFHLFYQLYMYTT